MTNKERNVLDWEFEELLRHLVLSYLKLDNFKTIKFATSIDTHQQTKEIYDITITRRGYEERRAKNE